MVVQARKKYKVITEKSVPMKTLDGITLFADVIRPDAAGRFPVLLSRTPYNKKGMDDPNGPNYLQQGANALRGDGTLSTVPPDKERADTYVYDPNAPVPSLGGNNLTIDIGVQDQRPVEERTDVLVYTSAPLEQPLEVTGPVTVTLWASSAAVDTDDLWATSNVFLPGHRIRLEISSSNFPRFDRNLNTGEPFGEGTKGNTYASDGVPSGRDGLLPPPACHSEVGVMGACKGSRRVR